MNLSLIEKSISIANGSLGLSAHLSTASREAPLLVLAHGFAGNKSENGLFSEASDFLAKRGFSILRFDFRGCGDSPGSFRQVRLSDLQTDLKSVLRFVHETDEVRPAAVGLIGFSLGAAVAILLRPRLPKVFVFWSPAIFTATDMFPRYQTREVLDQIREKGFFVKAGLEVSREFMDDLVNNEIEYSIRGMRAPVLLLHGEKDSRIPLSSSQQAKKLFRTAEFKVIRDADHSFTNGNRDQVFLDTLNWLRQHLKESGTSTGLQTRIARHASKARPVPEVQRHAV